MTHHWAIHHIPEVTSTQDVARQMIAEGETGYFAIRADHQTSGRGRSGRSWTSLTGNLQSTLVMPMTFDVSVAANYSFLTAVALSSAIEKMIGDRGKIEHKWPNDIWVNGQKIAGILLEIHKKFLLIGTGVNIGEAPQDAVSINELSERPVDVGAFLDLFTARMDDARQLMDHQGFGMVLDKWLEKARGLGEVIRVRTLKEEFHGVFDGLEPNGALRVVVQGEPEPRIIYAADVFFGKE